MMYLEVTATILAVLFIVICLIWFLSWLLYFRLKRSLFNQKHQYTDENLIKINQYNLGVYNESQNLYDNNNFLVSFIDKYIVSNNKNNKKLIVKYNDEEVTQIYNVLCFDKKLNVIEIIKVEDFNNDLSAEFELNKKTSYINVTTEVYKGKYNQRKRNLFKLVLVNVMFFSFIFSASYFIMSFINKNFLNIYLNNGGLILWLMLLMFAVLGFLMVSISRYSLVNTKEVIYHEK